MSVVANKKQQLAVEGDVTFSPKPLLSYEDKKGLAHTNSTAVESIEEDHKNLFDKIPLNPVEYEKHKAKLKIVKTHRTSIEKSRAESMKPLTAFTKSFKKTADDLTASMKTIESKVQYGVDQYEATMKEEADKQAKIEEDRLARIDAEIKKFTDASLEAINMPDEDLQKEIDNLSAFEITEEVFQEKTADAAAKLQMALMALKGVKYERIEKAENLKKKEEAELKAEETPEMMSFDDEDDEIEVTASSGFGSKATALTDQDKLKAYLKKLSDVGIPILSGEEEKKIIDSISQSINIATLKAVQISE